MTVEFGDWLYAIAVVGGSFLAGAAVDALLVSLLLRKDGAEPRMRQSFGRALRGQPEVWGVLLGVALFHPFAFLAPSGQTWLARLIAIATILSVTVFVTRLSGWLLRAYLRQDSVSAPSGTIFVNLARLMIWAVGLTFVLGALGVQIGPLMASLGVVGLAVSLGLQDTLANFFAGLQMTLSRQIQPGDYIRLSTSEEGTVHDVTWRNTTVRSPGGDLVIVPNAVIGKALITNFTSVDQSHTSSIPFTVAYGTDLARVKHLAEQIACEVRDSADAAVKEFEPTCRFTVFKTDGVQGSVSVRVDRYQDRFPVVEEIVTRLHERLSAEGVAFGANAAPAAATAPVAPTATGAAAAATGAAAAATGAAASTVAPGVATPAK